MPRTNAASHYFNKIKASRLTDSTAIHSDRKILQSYLLRTERFAAARIITNLSTFEQPMKYESQKTLTLTQMAAKIYHLSQVTARKANVSDLCVKYNY